MRTAELRHRLPRWQQRRARPTCPLRRARWLWVPRRRHSAPSRPTRGSGFLVVSGYLLAHADGKTKCYRGLSGGSAPLESSPDPKPCVPVGRNASCGATMAARSQHAGAPASANMPDPLQSNDQGARLKRALSVSTRGPAGTDGGGGGSGGAGGGSGGGAGGGVGEGRAGGGGGDGGGKGGGWVGGGSGGGKGGGCAGGGSGGRKGGGCAGRGMSGAGQSGCGREGGDGVRGGGAVGNGSQGGNGGVAGGSGHRMCRLLCVSNTELPALGASCQRMAAALAAAPIPATAPTLQRKRCGSLAPEAWPSGPSTPTQLRLPHTSLRSSWETKAVRNTGSAPSCSWTTSSASNALTAERRKMASSSSPSSTGASPSSTGGAVRTVARGTGAWSSSVQLRIVTPSARAGRQTCHENQVGC